MVKNNLSSQLKPTLERKGAVVVEMGNKAMKGGDIMEDGKWMGSGKAQKIQASKV